MTRTYQFKICIEIKLVLCVNWPNYSKRNLMILVSFFNIIYVIFKKTHVLSLMRMPSENKRLSLYLI